MLGGLREWLYPARRLPSAEARAKVAAFLAGSSLDDLVAIASNSLESRIRSRISDPGEAG